MGGGGELAAGPGSPQRGTWSWDSSATYEPLSATRPGEDLPGYDPQQGVCTPESERRIREEGREAQKAARRHYAATGDSSQMWEAKSATNEALRADRERRNPRW